MNHSPSQNPQKILDRVAAESETVGGTSMGRAASQISDGEPSADEDRIEQIGTKIGRGLSLVAFAVLAVYLFFTYVLK